MNRKRSSNRQSWILNLHCSTSTIDFDYFWPDT